VTRGPLPGRTVIEHADLPSEAGYFLWYILDLGYLKVGMVQVYQDGPLHLAYRINNPVPEAYVYKSGHLTFTMYHQAHDHLPPLAADHKPMVDGWIPFDFRTIDLIRKPAVKLELKRIPRR
jgi:hypothetical protein